MEKSNKTTSSSSKSGSKRAKAGASRSSADGSASDDTSHTKTRVGTSNTTDVKADALDFLKAQHQEVKQLFTEFEDAEDDNAALEVARVICQKLTVHATIEEEIFYPAARAKEELKDGVLEALEEHLSVKRLIADIEEADADDETLKAKVSVLEEQVTHHVKEEETELFPMARKAFSKEERRVMGHQLSERSEALAASDASADDSVDDSLDSEAKGDDDQEDESSPGHNGRHPPHSSIHSNH